MIGRRLLRTPRQIQLCWLMRFAAPAALLAALLFGYIDFTSDQPLYFMMMVFCAIINAVLTYIEWFVFVVPTKRRL